MADIEVKEAKKVAASSSEDKKAVKNKAANKNEKAQKDTFVSKLAKKLMPKSKPVEPAIEPEKPDFEDKFKPHGAADESLHEQIVIEDKFGADNPAEASQEEIRRLKAEKAKEILDRRVINPITETQKKLLEPANTALTKTNEAVNGFSAKITDITDKIAAVIGEREKDIRERLSNTYMRMEIQVYDLMEKIDASLDQKDHSKEQQGKKPETIETAEENEETIDNKSA